MSEGTRRLRLLALLAFLGAVGSAYAQPQSLRLGESASVHLNTKGAVAEFDFDVTQTGYVVAKFDKVPSGFYPAVSYYAGTVTLRDEKQDPSVRLEPGHYTVRIKSRFDIDVAKQPFSITLDFSAEDDSSEPNDVQAHARPIALGDSVILRLLPKGDVDLLTFTVPETAYVRVKCAEEKLTAHPAAELLDVTGQSLGKAAGEFTRRLEPGTYYLRVAAKFSDWSLQSVTVTTDIFVEGDSSEPNDTLATARSIALDENIRFWILPAGDQDVFRVEAPSDGYLWFGYTRAADPLRLVPEWLAQDGSVLSSEWMRKVTTGPVYLRVRDRHDWTDRQSSRAVYGSVSFLPELDPSEPNDTFETARPVALNTATTLYFLPAHDVDVWKFEIPERGMVTASLTMAPLEPSLERYDSTLYDAKFQSVTVTGAGQNAFEVILEPGTYFLKMGRRDDEHSGFEPLTVELEYTPLSEIQSSDIKFTLIGLGEESNAVQQQQFRQLTEVMGGTYIPIKDLTTDVQRVLTQELQRASGQPSQRRPSRRVLFFVILLGIIVGIVIWRIRGGSHAR